MGLLERRGGEIWLGCCLVALKSQERPACAKRAGLQGGGMWVQLCVNCGEFFQEDDWPVPLPPCPCCGQPTMKGHFPVFREDLTQAEQMADPSKPLGISRSAAAPRSSDS